MFLGRQPCLRCEGFPTFQGLILSLKKVEEEKEKKKKTRGPPGFPVHP
jgi:hypothetical protein